MSLNWLSLGCPPAARLGSRISESQHIMLERLESMIRYFLTAPDIKFDDLGRAAEKLANLCKVSSDWVQLQSLDMRTFKVFKTLYPPRSTLIHLGVAACIPSLLLVFQLTQCQREIYSPPCRSLARPARELA